LWQHPILLRFVCFRCCLGIEVSRFQIGKDEHISSYHFIKKKTVFSWKLYL
jgi:hypothetical protein